MATTNRLSESLVAAIRGGDAEMRAWYRELADASPLWSRQQDQYEQRWGRQTSEAQPEPVPWSLMSKRAEREANHELSIARVYLELIADLPDATPFTQAALQPYHDARVERNKAGPHGLQHALRKLVEFASAGLDRLALRALRKDVQGSAAQSRAQTGLGTDVVAVLIQDSEKWLRALASARASLSESTSERHRLRLALPFLDAVEMTYLLGGDVAATSWQWTAAYLVHDRFAAFEKHVEVATLIEYAFGTGPERQYKDERGDAARINPIAELRNAL